ncbi:hypothetical protein BGZ65_004600 [Modicella reniformis]|uniref:tRNA:m(4)X modification enzyme TRM13 n=1 Tax=Modicella reniformis TaxID=1440133 RepID=A0A9P6MB80_9FUNG|nr:hypothetical protein BGZ65_004600 [Modicella reniformis]
MQVNPVICQHAVWGSKQQRYRHCKLPAKLSADLLNQIKLLQEQCFQANKSATEEDHQDHFLTLRNELLQPEYDAQQVLCGHHRKETQVAQEAVDEVERKKSIGTSADLKQQSKEQPIDAKDIPKRLVAAIERVFSTDSSSLVKELLDHWDGPEEWKMGQRNYTSRDLVLDRDIVEIDFPCHESFEGLFADAGVKRKRHLVQESQLINSMASLGLLDPVLNAESCGAGIEQEGYAADRSSSRTGAKRRPVFVEFGAGTGGLSRHIQLVLETIVCKCIADPYRDSPPSLTTTTAAMSSETNGRQPSLIEPLNFILLDRQKFRSRNQVDYMIRTQARPVRPRLLRITKDVRELKIQDLQLIHETEPGVARPEWTEGGDMDPQETSTKIPTHYICVSKHFCGPATDMVLAWIRDQQKHPRQREAIQQDSYSICFATCCHGICEPSLVVAKPYLGELFNVACAKKEGDQRHCSGTYTSNSSQGQEQLEVSEEDLIAWIPWVIKLTGWATLGKQEESSLVARPGKDAPTTSSSNGNDGATMTRDQRRVLGKRCKKLLDMARCLYLIRECRFKQAKAIEYTSESVESGAIVGTM